MAPPNSVLVALRLLIVLAGAYFWGPAFLAWSGSSDGPPSDEICSAGGYSFGEKASEFATQPLEQDEQAFVQDGNSEWLEPPEQFGRFSASWLLADEGATTTRGGASASARQFWIIGKLSRGPPQTNAS